MLQRGLALRREARTLSVAQFIEDLGRQQHPGGQARTLLLAGGTFSFVAAAGLAAWLVWPEIFPGDGLGKPSPETSVVAPLEEIQTIVRTPPCSLLRSAASQGSIHLQGHAHSETDVASVTQRLQALPGVTSVLPSVSLLKDAHCPAIEVARPFVFANWNVGSPFAIRPSKLTFVKGDALVLNLVADDRDGFAYVDYYDVFGNVVHMLPRPKAPDNYVRAGERLTLGTGGRLGEWVVAPPYGRDIVIAIKTPEPLFQGPRQREIEPAEDYVPDLRERLTRLIERYSADAVLADYALITTQPK